MNMYDFSLSFVGTLLLRSAGRSHSTRRFDLQEILTGRMESESRAHRLTKNMHRSVQDVDANLGPFSCS